MEFPRADLPLVARARQRLPDEHLSDLDGEIRQTLATAGLAEVVKPGQRVAIMKGGGGGFGDPLERDPCAVREDVLDEYVSLEGARRDYGVVLDPQTLEVDWEATAAARQQRTLPLETAAVGRRPSAVGTPKESQR